jgi:hypothetical protein
MRKIMKFSILVFAVSLCQPAIANDDLASEEEAEVVALAGAADTNAKSEEDSGAGPADRPGFGSFAPKFQLQANEGATELSFSIGFGSSGLSGDGPTYKLHSDRFAFSVSSPITEKAEESAFAFSALEAGTKAKFSYINYSGKYKYSNEMNELRSRYLDKAMRSCSINLLAIHKNFNESETINRAIQLLSSQPIDFDMGLVIKTLTQFAEKNAGIGPKAKNALEAAQFKPESFNKPLLAKIDECRGSTGGGQAAVLEAYLSKKELAELGSSGRANRYLRFWGVSGAIANEKFDYLDVPTISKISTDRVGYEARAFVGLINTQDDFSFRASAKYLRMFKSAEETQLCKPVAVAGTPPECITGANGKPTKSNSTVIEVEARKLFPFGAAGEGSKIAIAPMVRYDVDKKDYSIEVPVFLAPNKEGRLDGGIRFGYRSDTKDFGIGLFVGIPFGTWFE